MYNVTHIKHIITRAGKIAREHFLNVDPRWKADRSYVTAADLAVQEYLHGELDKEYPDDGIVGEEEGLQKSPRRGTRRWIIDPIDGTAAFSAGLPVWGIAIALVEDTHPLAGFFYMPLAQDLIYTTPDGQVFRNDRPQSLRDPEPFHRETSLFIASRLHRYYTVTSSYPGKLRNLGSSMAHLAYVATGSAACALVERVYIWDIAAGMAMLQAGGGVLRYIDGPPVDLGALLNGAPAQLPMLGGHPDVVSAFSKIIAFRAEGNNDVQTSA
jgi:myo-inositol-1(or 4)-monophosphatase